jgi:hypothetical protein
MAVDERVRVFVEPDEIVQHFALPPDSDTALAWDGETLCGVAGNLRWVSPENVDVGQLCPSCADAQGSFSAPLQGEHLGPV